MIKRDERNQPLNDAVLKDFIGYLKPDVIVEPLVNQWYAWSYLIPPATASRYLTQSQIQVMQSFVDAPEVHETTLRDPAMMGGPFIQHPASRVGEVRSLLDKTKEEQSRLLGLSHAIDHLRTQLANHPPGQSLEPLYDQIPEALKGYVELVYDANNSASIRFIEGLLYRSEYYSTASQSIALRIADCDERAFVMSTPRLPDDSSLFLSIPFADPRLDQLFQMRHTAGSVSAIATLFNIPEQKLSFFYSLFTAESPRKPEPYQGDGIRVRYFGHACVLIETSEISILCDPLVSYEHPTGMPRYSYTDLPETIDYALITHNHQDHVMFETLLQLRHKIKHVVVPSSQKGSLLDPSLKLALQQIGFSQTLTLDELDSIPLPDGSITSIPVLGEHGDLNITTKNAYWITLKGRSILCAADSNNLDPNLYAHIHHLLGDLDLLFLGMECEGAPYTWAYGPLLPNSVPHAQAQSRRLDGSNAKRALALVNQLNPQQVYIYAMGQEPWLTYITSIDYAPDAPPILESNQLIAACLEKGKKCDFPTERLCQRLLGQHQIDLTPIATTNQKTAPIPTPSSHQTQQTTLSLPTAQRSTLHQQQSELSSPTPPLPHSPTPMSDTLTPFLNHLQTLDIRLWLEGDTLRCNAPKGALTPALTAELKANKPAIIALLKGSAVNTHSPNSATQKSDSSAFKKNTPQSTESADWQQDIQLPPEIHPQAPSAAEISHQTNNILLTGATGFLGAFILHELLLQTKKHIHCLVRASDSAEGLAKLKQCLANYKIWKPAFEPRIQPIAGDLSQPYLGLSKQQFYTLA
ncbi:MAG: SDR family oxidoreductase, partial [Cyanobacteria bacterium P01_D01_bin.115]